VMEDRVLLRATRDVRPQRPVAERANAPARLTRVEGDCCWREI
jgi:hypothetical protein